VSETDAKAIVRDGLWSRNTGLVALLGLCPLLAVSNTAVNALGLGLATVAVLALTNLAISLLRAQIHAEIRIPAQIVVIAATVTVVELAMHAWASELYRVLGLFIPLIVTNCAVMGRAEAFAARQPPLRALLDGIAVGLGFLWVLLAIGAIRELLGQGTLFAGAARFLGAWAAPLEITLLDGYRGFLPALLPMGAFVVLAFLIAGKNVIDARRPGAVAGAPATGATT
jgi:electron transport complex protein RnfE